MTLWRAAVFLQESRGWKPPVNAGMHDDLHPPKTLRDRNYAILPGRGIVQNKSSPPLTRSPVAMTPQSVAAYFSEEDSREPTAHELRLLIERSGRIYFCSAEANPILGHLSHELRATSLFGLMEAADAVQLRRLMAQVDRTAAPPLHFRLRLRHKAGSFCVLAATIETSTTDFLIRGSLLSLEQGASDDKDTGSLFRRARLDTIPAAPAQEAEPFLRQPLRALH